MADIYPNEAYPSDASIALLDGTVDQPTGLPFIAKGTGPTSVPSYEIQYNRRLQRQNNRLAVAGEGLVVAEGGLTIGVYPLNYTLGGVRKRFVGATAQAVPDNATRFVYIDATNALQVASAYPTDISAHIPLAKVVALAGAITVLPESGYARVAALPLQPQLGITVGVETADTINVAFALEDEAGNAISWRWLAELWVADAAYGDLASVAPSGGIVVATGQQIGSALAANKHLKVMSDAGGVVAIDVSHTGAAIYHVVVDASGSALMADAAIAFAA